MGRKDSSAPGAAFGHHQRLAAAAVRAEEEVPQRRLVRRFHQRGRGTVGEDRPQRPICRIDVAGVGLGGDQQHAAGGAAANQPVGQRQPVNESRAAEVEVQRADGGGQPQAILDEAGGGRQRVVGSLGAEEQEVDRAAVDPIFVEELFRRGDPQVRSALPLVGDRPAANAGLGEDCLHVPVRELGRQCLVGFDPRGKMDGNGAKRRVFHRRSFGDAEEKGDSPHLCEAPSGPFRQMGTVPFFPLGDAGL